MPDCFFCAWWGLFITLFGLFTTLAFYFGIKNVTATGNETREGRIETFCTAAREWENSGQKQLHKDALFTLRLRSGSDPISSKCVVSSERNTIESGINDLTDKKCDVYSVRKVVCSLHNMIKDPAITNDYVLALYSHLFSSQSVNLVGVLHLKVGTVKEQAPPRSTRNGESQRQKDLQQKSSCTKAGGKVVMHEEAGILGTSESVHCRFLFRLKLSESPDASCYTLKPAANASFTLAQSLWMDDQAIDKALINAYSRCIRPISSWNTEPDMQVGPPDTKLETAQSLSQRLSKSSVTFRMEDDPFVVASTLSDSSFDFGYGKGAKAVLGVFLILIGSCCSCCTLGGIFGFCRMAVFDGGGSGGGESMRELMRFD